jgi:hypothetical protein
LLIHVDMRHHGVEILDVEDLAAGEHIEDGLPVVTVEAENEVAREVDAVAVPARDLRAVQPDHAEPDRHATPPLRHADQVDVPQIVVGIAIAAVVVPAAEHGGHGLALVMRTAAGPMGQLRRLAREKAEMGPRTAPIGLGRVEPREEQRRFRQRDLLVRQAPHRVQRRADGDLRMLAALARCGRRIGFVRQGHSPLRATAPSFGAVQSGSGAFLIRSMAKRLVTLRSGNAAISRR